MSVILAVPGRGGQGLLASIAGGRLDRCPVLLALGGAGQHAGRDGQAWTGWEQQGPGLPPQQILLPPDLPGD